MQFLPKTSRVLRGSRAFVMIRVSPGSGGGITIAAWRPLGRIHQRGHATSCCRARGVESRAEPGDTGVGGRMNRREFARLLAIGGAAPFMSPNVAWPRPLD